ncbi:MAG: hypothetical protein HKP27_14650 [Myxococcales bacterium]|nr:hypothetical protein [Myxococcales bacterium]
MVKALGFLAIAGAIWLAVEGYMGNLPSWLSGATAEANETAPPDTTLRRAESAVQRSVADSEERTRRMLGE